MAIEILFDPAPFVVITHRHGTHFIHNYLLDMIDIYDNKVLIINWAR